jgi:signal transduction histidine kinase/CheY-like chemotaxis protein
VDQTLFDADVWGPALKKYGGVTHVTVALYDADGQLVCGPIHPTPIADLFGESDYGSGFFDDCVQHCLRRAQTLPEITLSSRHGVAAVAAPLVSNGEVTAAAVAGYHLIEFPQSITVERLARDVGLASARIWDVVRQEAPISRQRFVAQGELLRVLGEALLTEQYRMRQHVELSARLQAADAAKDQFLAMVSHELRGPLNAMLGWARLLRMQPLKETAREHALETIERNALAQARLIEDLLDISRIVAGRMQIEPQPVALAPVVQRAIEGISPMAASKAMRLDAQLQDLSAPVSGDAAQLQQIVTNLLSNAVKFTPPGGEVSIRLIASESEAELSVADTGEGITAEFLPHIFEPFRQQDSSRTRVHGGLGLGLTITRHLVALHGGSIRAESAGVGQGATFRIRLPLNTAPAAAAPGPDRSSPGVFGPVDSLPDLLRRVHVLVVEDNDDARGLMQMILEEAGAEVTAVASAEEALTELERTRPDVLVSDIGLPGEDGYALIRKVRMSGAERGDDIPAIAVTAWASAADRDRAMSAGYHVHIAKPFDAATLIETIRSVVPRARTLSRYSRPPEL